MIAGVDYSNAKSAQLVHLRRFRALETELRDGEKEVRDFGPSLKEMTRQRGEIVEIVKEWIREVQKLGSGTQEVIKVDNLVGEAKRAFEVGRDVAIRRVCEDFAGKIIRWFDRVYGTSWGKDGLPIKVVE